MPAEDLAAVCKRAFADQRRAWVCVWGRSLTSPSSYPYLTLWLQMGSLDSETGGWGELAWTQTVSLQTRWIHTVPRTRQSEFKPGLRRGSERQLDTQPVSFSGQTSLRNPLSDNVPPTVTFWGLLWSQSISNSIYLLLIWCHSGSSERMSNGTTCVLCESLLQ